METVFAETYSITQSMYLNKHQRRIQKLMSCENMLTAQKNSSILIYCIKHTWACLTAHRLGTTERNSGENPGLMSNPLVVSVLTLQLNTKDTSNNGRASASNLQLLVSYHSICAVCEQSHTKRSLSDEATKHQHGVMY